MAKSNKQAGAQQPERKGPKVCRPNGVDFDKMRLTKLNTEGKQSVSYINYTDTGDEKDATSLFVQSEKIQLTHHGIPQLDKKDAKEQFYTDDSQREFIKIPLVPGVPEADELRKNLTQADAHFGSDAVRKQLFGKNEKNYEYTPCIRTPPERTDDDDSKSKKSAKKDAPRIDYCKMKFHFTGQVPDKVNKTKLTRVIGTTKTPVVAQTVTDIANEIRYMSTVKFIFQYFKVWANKTLAQGAKKKVYGVGFKIVSIQYTPGPNNRINPDSIEFISDDDGDEKKTTKSSSSSKKAPKLDDSDDDTPKPKGKQTKKANSDSEEESDKMPSKSTNSNSDEESDSPKSKKTTKGKPTPKPAESDSDESSEPAPPKKGAKGKPTPKPVESDSDESSEPTPPKKGAKGKPAPKPAESDSDDSEPKPAKKAAKGKGKAKPVDSDNESASEEVPIQSKTKPKAKAASRGK